MLARRSSRTDELEAFNVDFRAYDENDPKIFPADPYFKYETLEMVLNPIVKKKKSRRKKKKDSDDEESEEEERKEEESGEEETRGGERRGGEDLRLELVNILINLGGMERIAIDQKTKRREK